MAEFKFKCPQCGGSVEADESFCGQVAECPHCSKNIVVPRVMGFRQIQDRRPSSIASNPTMKRNADQMFCTMCGAIINSQAFFCPRCGAAIDRSNVMMARNVQISINSTSPNTSSAPLVLGILSLITWLIPIIGLPVSITGIALSAKHNRNGCLALNVIGALLSLLNFIFALMIGISS